MTGNWDSCVIRNTPRSRLSGSVARRHHAVVEGLCWSCQLFLEHGKPSAASGCGFFSMSLSPAEPTPGISCLCEVFLGDGMGLRLSASVFILCFMDVVDTQHPVWSLSIAVTNTLGNQHTKGAVLVLSSGGSCLWWIDGVCSGAASASWGAHSGTKLWSVQDAEGEMRLRSHCSV